MALLSDRESTTRPQARTAGPAVERVLFALTATEREQMFPGFDGDAFLPAQSSWAPAEALARSENWQEFLREFRPTVLVSCWCTLPVPFVLWKSDALPLRYICHVTGTVKNVAPREILTEGGIVTNWGDLISHTVAEHALLLILASLRNLPRWHPARPSVLRDAWGRAESFETLSLQGRKVGIHGFGNIARALVRLLEPFGVRCSAYSEGVPTQHMIRQGVRPCTSLEELFSQSEVLVECEALTPRTAGVVTDRHFRLLPDRGVFVNVARAALVNEAAMEAVVAEGRVRVASDVFHHEPLSEGSPYFDAPGMIVSPHIAGPTSDWHARCGDFALQNIERYLAGLPLAGIVTPEIYDRST